MFRGYATAIGDVLPTATLVIDHFHAIRLASEAVNDVRRRVQQDQLGHRGRKIDPLYGIRRLLLRTWANLNERGWERLRAGLAAGDPDGEVAAVWLARELLAEVYAARDLAHAKRRLIVFFQHAADVEIPELTRLATTIDRWRDEVLAFHTTGGASNGPTEAVNLLSRRSAASATATATSTTIDAGSSSAAASHGLPSPPAESEAANQRSPRRAGYRFAGDADCGGGGCAPGRCRAYSRIASMPFASGGVAERPPWHGRRYRPPTS